MKSCAVIMYNLSFGILVCVLALGSATESEYSGVIEVSESCSSHCCNQSNTHVICSSLDELSSFIRNNKLKEVEIFLNCTFCSLRTLVSFDSVINVSICGQHKTTTVNCELGNDTNGVGLSFKHATNILLSNVSFVSCGVLHASTSRNTSDIRESVLYFRSALYFENCADISVAHTTVKDTSGTGIVLYDCVGSIAIEFATFETNYVRGHNHEDLPGGGGVYIEFTPCSPGRYSQIPSTGTVCNPNKSGGHFEVINSTFIDNKAHSLRSYFNQTGFRTFGQGGGILISLRGNASRNSFLVGGCRFVNNTALWGGGLHLLIMDFSRSNRISVSGSSFEGNEAKDGGGAVAIYVTSTAKRYGDFFHESMGENWIDFSNCTMRRNNASQGGGLIIFTSHKYANDHASNKLEFYHVNWIGNTAVSGAAVDITTKDVTSVVLGPFPTFVDCKFIKNEIHAHAETLDEGHAVQSRFGKASFLITLCKVFFNASVLFFGNNMTALHISAGVASFSEDMNATFEENVGVRGGAISLISSSYLEVRAHSFFYFINNVAFVQGGAIYSDSLREHELHDHVHSLGCFVHYHKQSYACLANECLHFIFVNNRVKGSSKGNSIFSTSVLACASNCHGNHSHLNASASLNCVANFTFINSSAKREVSSAESTFVIHEPLPSKVIPGKKIRLNISLSDSLNNLATPILRTYVKSANGLIAIDDTSHYISDNTLLIYGQPGARGRVYLENVGYHSVDLSFDIEITHCPPGYSLFQVRGDKLTYQCVCAWSSQMSYHGLLKCNHTRFQAYILHGTWTGYDDGNESEDNLFTAYCPLNFCSYSNSDRPSHFHLLPGEANRSKLREYICSERRKGWLCGTCVDGYSVYFHSPNYECRPDVSCGFGPLLYFISELVPLTLLFAAIVIFRVNITSGTLTGFIFFAQVIDAILLDLDSLVSKSIDNSRHLLILNWASLFVYRILNLNFFAINSLSFCLWKGATTLDIIAFKYLTIAFAFFLVLATYLLMNCCNFYRCRRRKFYRHFFVRTSIIHGISTFLVMCFAQCVHTSFLLLTPGRIYQKGGALFESRLLYLGDIPMYSSEHARYAIPAFICIFVLVVLPTILLLWYPLGPKVLSFCGLGEISVMSKVVPLHKMKPFFDCFQSCFKDNLRFFSGLYFAYRILLIAANTFSIGLTQFYVLVDVLLAVMLMLHALAQPYKNRWHNATDALIFSNLIFITSSSLFIYIKSPERLYREAITCLIYIQTFLISLPLLVMILCLSFLLVKTLKSLVIFKFSKSNPYTVNGAVLDNEFPSRLVDLDDTESDESPDYNLLTLT